MCAGVNRRVREGTVVLEFHSTQVQEFKGVKHTGKNAMNFPPMPDFETVAISKQLFDYLGSCLMRSNNIIFIDNEMSCFVFLKDKPTPEVGERFCIVGGFRMYTADPDIDKIWKYYFLIKRDPSGNWVCCTENDAGAYNFGNTGLFIKLAVDCEKYEEMMGSIS